MKPNLFQVIIPILSLFLSLPSHAGGKKGSGSVSYEINGDVSYVGGAKTKIGNIQLGDVTEQSTSLQAIQSREIGEGNLLRLGMGWQRFSFGLPNSIALPNTLQSVNAIVGADMEIADSWLMRVEASPGLYSDFVDIDGEDFNAPLILGASYLASEDVQWFMGMSVNARRDIPVLPGAGVRWKFADQWTLMALFPKPRLEYEINDSFTLYGGGEIKSDTYKVSKTFGSTHGQTSLNDADLDYTEGRIGIGGSWKIHPAISLDFEAGAMIYRQFDFHSADTKLKADSTAPYGQLFLHTDF